MGWQVKFALCCFVVAIVLALMSSGANAAIMEFRAVLCPADWTATLSQRFDTRDRFDWIIKRTWIAKCY
jgi:hypothetical protein